MQVIAFSTPTCPDWRWRIVNYAGEVIEESQSTFRTIATAVQEGSRRLLQMNVVDRSTPPRMFRSSAHSRRPAAGLGH